MSEKATPFEEDSSSTVTSTRSTKLDRNATGTKPTIAEGAIVAQQRLNELQTTEGIDAKNVPAKIIKLKQSKVNGAKKSRSTKLDRDATGTKPAIAEGAMVAQQCSDELQTTEGIDAKNAPAKIIKLKQSKVKGAKKSGSTKRERDATGTKPAIAKGAMVAQQCSDGLQTTEGIDAKNSPAKIIKLKQSKVKGAKSSRSTKLDRDATGTKPAIAESAMVAQQRSDGLQKIEGIVAKIIKLKQSVVKGAKRPRSKSAASMTEKRPIAKKQVKIIKLKQSVVKGAKRPRSKSAASMTEKRPIAKKQAKKANLSNSKKKAAVRKVQTVAAKKRKVKSPARNQTKKKAFGTKA